jgi:predicted Zn-dependent protease
MNRYGKLSKELILLVGGFLLIGISLAVLIDEPEKEDLNTSFSMKRWSVDHEAKLGEYMEEMHLAGAERIHDTVLDQGIDQIKARLFAGLDSIQYDYHFRVIRNEEPNAFTLPGGRIILHSGLIQFCEGPAELAAVIAHEIGHAEQRHVVDRLMAEVGVSVLLSFISGGDPSVVHQLSAWLLTNVFSRSQEREADAFAHALLIKTRISPHHLGSFFERIDEQENSYDLPWLSTHPSHDERVMNSASVELPSPFEEKMIDVDWWGMQAVVNDL